MHQAFKSNIPIPYGCLLYSKQKQSQAFDKTFYVYTPTIEVDMKDIAKKPLK